MIRLNKYTPNIYYEQSRDFQFIGRLYDVVLNSVKTNADIIKYGLPFNDQSPQELLVLMSRTLGFKPKHQYSRNQLHAICNIFSEVLRNKGNVRAVQLIGDAILKAEGILGTVACFMQYDDNRSKYLPVLKIVVPTDLSDITLFYDLLDYIIPAGCLIEIIRGEYLPPVEAVTEVTAEDKFVVLREVDANKITRNYHLKTPISNMSQIQHNINKDGDYTSSLTKNHIANAFIWRKGNKRTFAEGKEKDNQ
jgi:hypothetical protein